MSHRILVFDGSYRSDRMGIRLAQFVIERRRCRADDVELIDAKAINLPILDRTYKEYRRAQAPEALEGWPARSAVQMGLCSSPANTTGASSRD